MHQKALTVSLVIPVYNEEHHLKRCLDAVTAQTSPPDEIIVVDNNSQDKTVEIAKQYDGVRVLQEKRQGVLFASRTGYDAAQTDIIARIDADTLLTPEWVAQIRQFFSENPDIAAVTGNCYFYDFPMRRTFRVIHHAVYYSMQKLIAGTEILWGSNMAMRTSAWQTVRSECKTDPGIHEDIDIALHMKNHGLAIRRWPKLVVSVSLRMMGVSTRHGSGIKRTTNFSPKIIVNYLYPWPRTYWINRRYISAILISLLLFAVWLVVLPLSAIVWLFHKFTF